MIKYLLLAYVTRFAKRGPIHAQFQDTLLIAMSVSYINAPTSHVFNTVHAEGLTVCFH